MKFFKKFLIYLAVILGGLVVVALGIFAYMYFAPNSPVLGLEYVSYKEKQSKTYTTSTELSVSGVKGVEIITEISDIYIFPNNNSDEIVVAQDQRFSGLAKSINSDLTLSVDVKNKSFEEKTTALKTFSVVVDEPAGWISKNNSYVAIYIPDSLAVDTIYAKSQSGNVFYASHNEEGAILKCVNLYLKTYGAGKIDISNKQNSLSDGGISNYYLSTGSGNVVFNDTTSIEAETVKFSTDSGDLKITNSTKDAVLKLSNGLYVTSNDSRRGPSVILNKLVGDLHVDAKNGYYKIDEIGAYGTYKSVAMTVSKSEINFGTVYGYVSILSHTAECENNISIDSLNYILENNYSANINNFETGRGNVVINSLKGDVAIDASTGSVNIKKADVESDIYTYSTSGSVYIKYDYVEDYDNADTDLKVITKTGNINLVNVSCLLEVKVQSQSANSSLNVAFSNVSYSMLYDNIIEAGNRNVRLKLVGISDYLQFRIASTGVVELKPGVVGADISTPKSAQGATNDDYLLGYQQYDGYTHSYRIGYTTTNETYLEKLFNSWGVLCIKNVGKISIEAQISVE